MKEFQEKKKIKKFTKSKIESIEIYNNDKIINIKVNSSSSYKKENLILQLEKRKILLLMAN